MSYFENKTNQDLTKKDLVENLTPQEKVIVWGAREWLQHIRLAKDPRESLIKGFSPLLIQESVYHFDKFMRITACSAIKQIDVRHKCCLQVGKGEKDILAALAFSQGKFEDFEKFILETFIEKKYIPLASKHINEVSRSFSRMGYFFHMKKEYLKKVNANPNDFQNVVFNKFNKTDFTKYY